MIYDYASLKQGVQDWMGRDDLEAKIDGFIAPVVADAATMLNIFVTETFLTQQAVEDQASLIVPSGFCGALALYVGDKRYHRRNHREVTDGEIKYSYSVYGEEIFFYPAAELDVIIRLEYRGMQRDGGAGAGVSVDDFGQLFFRTKPFTDQTVEQGDARGRFALLIDEIKTPIRDDTALSTEDANVDFIGDQYNAAERLIRRFPNVFRNGSLMNAYEYIQDEERATYWDRKYKEQIGLAKNQLMAAKYGGDKLRIQPRNRTLLQGRRK